MATEGCFNFKVSCTKKTDSADDGVINWLELCGACTGFKFLRIFIVLSVGGTSSPPTGINASTMTITMNGVEFQALLDCLDGNPTDAVVTICYKQVGNTIIVSSVSCSSATVALTLVLAAINVVSAELGDLRQIVKGEIAPALIKSEHVLLEIAAQLRK